MQLPSGDSNLPAEPSPMEISSSLQAARLLLLLLLGFPPSAEREPGTKPLLPSIYSSYFAALLLKYYPPPSPQLLPSSLSDQRLASQHVHDSTRTQIACGGPQTICSRWRQKEDHQGISPPCSQVVSIIQVPQQETWLTVEAVYFLLIRTAES